MTLPLTFDLRAEGIYVSMPFPIKLPVLALTPTGPVLVQVLILLAVGRN